MWWWWWCGGGGRGGGGAGLIFVRADRTGAPHPQVALLLGVQVDFGAPVPSLAALDELGFHACGTLTDSADFIRKHQFVSGNNGSTLGLRKVSVPFHILIDATGARCPLFESLGFEQLTALKSAQVSRRRFTRGSAAHPTTDTPHAARRRPLAWSPTSSMARRGRRRSSASRIGRRSSTRSASRG